jgi:death-on-curing protein
VTEPKWILDDVVLAIHSMVLAEHGGIPGLRDSDLLASALDRPKNKFAYDSAATLYDLAAAYSFALAKNHPFVDGNKRTAFMCGSLFLELNQFQLAASEPDATATLESLAAGNMTESELAIWFKANTRQA